MPLRRTSRPPPDSRARAPRTSGWTRHGRPNVRIASSRGPAVPGPRSPFSAITARPKSTERSVSMREVRPVRGSNDREESWPSVSPRARSGRSRHFRPGADGPLPIESSFVGGPKTGTGERGRRATRLRSRGSGPARKSCRFPPLASRRRESADSRASAKISPIREARAWRWLFSQGERESGRAGVLEQYRASLRSKRQVQKRACEASGRSRSELAKQAAGPEASLRSKRQVQKRACEASGIEHPGRVQRGENSQIRVRSRESGRVEDWRANSRVRWRFRRFRSGPQSGSRSHVSSPRSSNRACGSPAPGSL